MDFPYYREYELPWAGDSAQERKFRRLLAQVMAVLLMLGVAWPFLPTPEPDSNEVEEVPERIAQLLLERKPTPPPPPKPEEQEPEPEPEPPPVDRRQAAREKARAALMPFARDLQSLRDNEVLDKVADDRPLTGAVGSAERNERSMIASNAAASSGGINTASMSRNTGGSGLAARATTAVENPVEGLEAAAGGAPRDGGTSGKASRSRAEIELVFDRNKGAIFALYNRALRQDPTLAGKLVLRLTIAPSGEVTFCEIVSSELDDAELERKLVQRVLLFRFDAKDVEPITTTKPIDFFPA